MKPELSLIIDAHMIGLFRDCEEKYNKRINQLLVPKKINGATGSGITFHEAVATYRRMRQGGAGTSDAYNGGLFKLREAYRKEMPPEFTDPINPCPDERRSLANLERIFEGFIPFEEGQKYTYHYIEQSMGISFGTIETDKAIYSIIYGGIIDAVVEQQGCIFVDDVKTTTINISQAYKDSFRLSQAMKGYIFGMRELLPKVIYGGMISLAWFQKEAKTKGKPLNEYFHSVPLTFNDEQISEWYANTSLTIRKIITADENAIWQMSQGSACSTYNGCTFKEICWTTPSVRERIIDTDFTRRTWTPLEEVRSKPITSEEWRHWLLARSVGGEE